MDLGAGEIGFIFCGKHPLIMTKIQVSYRGPNGPLFEKANFAGQIMFWIIFPLKIASSWKIGFPLSKLNEEMNIKYGSRCRLRIKSSSPLDKSV